MSQTKAQLVAPVGILTVTGISASGIVTASSYRGDGSQLTGIVAGATLTGSGNTERLVLTSQTSGTMTSAATTSNLTYNTSLNTFDLNGTTLDKSVLRNYTEGVSALGNTGTAATINLANGNVFTATLTGNCTFTFTTGVTSGAASFTLILTNDGTAGRSIIWPPAVKWPNNSTPVRTTTANATDIWSFFTPDNGTTWYGNIALYNFT